MVSREEYLNDARISAYDITQDIRRLADELGRTPTAAEYEEHGEYSRHPIKRHFGSWNDALRVCGLKLNKEHGIPDERLLRDLRLVALDLGFTPSMRDYAGRGNHAVETFQRRFGPWDESLEAARLNVKGKQHRITEYGSNRGGRRPTLLGLEDLDPEDVGLSPLGERGSV